MKLSIDTIIMYVQNVDKLRAFYVTVLGLEVVEESGSEWLLLKAGAGNCKIGLHKIGKQYLDDNDQAFKFDNNTKIVFETAEDINMLRQQLLNQNVQMQEVKTFDNYDYWLCDGEDPEGNVFQLKQRKQ
jgi:catechol-2,3-dioxygenase